MKSRIFLIGFMGSGKSTLGARLARKLGYTFADMDQIIEETSEMRIPEIFEEHGESIFRKWERDILLELCQKEQLVIATGGGAPCYDDMMDLMNAAGTTVYIQMSPPALRDRLLHSRTERPLIKGKSAEELLDYISSMLSSREPYYQKAHVKVDGCHLDAAALQQAIALH